MLKHEGRDHHSEVETGIPSTPGLVVGMNDRIIDFAPNANRQTGHIDHPADPQPDRKG